MARERREAVRGRQDPEAEGCESNRSRRVPWCLGPGGGQNIDCWLEEGVLLAAKTAPCFGYAPTHWLLVSDGPPAGLHEDLQEKTRGAADRDRKYR